MAGIELPRALPGRGSRRRGIDLPGAEDVPRAPITRDPGVKVQQSFGTGEGLVKAGEAIAKFAAGAFEAAERQQKLHDATTTSEAALAFDRTAMDELNRRQTEDDPSRPDFMSDYEKWAVGTRQADGSIVLGGRAKEAFDALPKSVSPEAREKFRTTLLSKGQGMVDAAGRLSLVAGQKKALDTITAQVNQWSAQVSRDPDFLEPILAEMADDTVGLGQYKGALTPDQERDSLSRARRDVVSAAVSGLVAKGRYTDAETLIASRKFDADLGSDALRSINADIHRGKLMARTEIRESSADHLASLRETGTGMPGLAERAKKILEPKDYAEFQRSEKLARDVYGAVQQLKFLPPEEARAALNALKPAPGTAGFAERQRAHDAVEREVVRIESEASKRFDELIAADRADVGDLMKADIASRLETGKGVEGLTIDRIGAAAKGPGERDRLVRDYIARRDMADKAFATREKLKTATPDEARRLLAELAPASGDPMFDERQRAVESVEREWARLLKLRLADPVGYTLQDPTVADAFKRAGENPAELPGAITKSLALQEQMGIPAQDRRVLTKAGAEAEVKRLGQIAPEDMADSLQVMAKSYGKHWSRAYRELVGEKLPEESIVLGILDRSDDAMTRKDFAQAVQTGRKTLEANLGTEVKSQIDRGLHDTMEPWARLEFSRGATDGNVQVMKSAAQMLAYSYASRGMTPAQAAQKAADAMVNSRYDILDQAGFSLYVPKGIGNDVADVARRTLSSLKPDDLMDPGGDPNLTPAQRRDLYLRAAQRGRWVLNESGDGTFLVDELGQPVAAMSSNFERAKTSLRLTEQEQYLYRHHLGNLARGGVRNRDGSVSTALVVGMEIDGREYNIPTVWDNKIVSADEAVTRARAVGLDKFPSYTSPKEADDRYRAIHDFMDGEGMRRLEIFFDRLDELRATLPATGPSSLEDQRNPFRPAPSSGRTPPEPR